MHISITLKTELSCFSPIYQHHSFPCKKKKCPIQNTLLEKPVFSQGKINLPESTRKTDREKLNHMKPSAHIFFQIPLQLTDISILYKHDF